MNNARNREELDGAGKVEPFKNVMGVVSNAASHIGEEVRHGAEEVGSVINSAAKSAATQLEKSGSEAIDSVTKRARQASDMLSEEVNRSPVLSLGIAFGLGLLFAGLVRRA